MREISEEQFLDRFRDLLLNFPNLLKTESSSGIRIDGLANLRQSLDSLSQNSQSGTVGNGSLLQTRIEEFIITISKTRFDNELIPYDKITEFVFIETPEELYFDFTTRLKTYGRQYFLKQATISQMSATDLLERESDTTSEVPNIDLSNCEKDFYRIVRHIDLALIQITKFASTKIEHLQSEYDNLNDQFSQLNNQITQLKSAAELQYKNMLTQFISILGIFAAILMGAFGAIQGFTSLFANAIGLSIGKIFILSSIGASSVVLILFFLLNAIAKLTDRSLSSTSKKDGTLFEKHPSLVLIHGILVFIILIGASLELSNVNLKFAWQGLWWLVPLFWFIYFITAVYQRDPFFIFNYFKESIKNHKNDGTGQANLPETKTKSDQSDVHNSKKENQQG
ncbi:hypothetical protein [Solibacillus sp. CAU 1738]|uniref:hypothetical protein n=1 Tax=Solibacillus sp. CAU 1738 TaxID=3140363 RepID=UPI00326190EA